MTDADRDRIAAIAARRWTRWRHYEDLRQAALIAVWRAGDRPEHHLQWIANNAVIDEVRRLGGRKDSAVGRRRRQEVLHDTQQMEHATVDADPLPLSFTLGLSGRSAMLVDALAAGVPKQEIAELLGVTPSAVSHMLPGLRRQIARSLR